MDFLFTHQNKLVIWIMELFNLISSMCNGGHSTVEICPWLAPLCCLLRDILLDRGSSLVSCPFISPNGLGLYKMVLDWSKLFWIRPKMRFHYIILLIDQCPKSFGLVQKVLKQQKDRPSDPYYSSWQQFSIFSVPTSQKSF